MQVPILFYMSGSTLAIVLLPQSSAHLMKMTYCGYTSLAARLFLAAPGMLLVILY